MTNTTILIIILCIALYKAHLLQPLIKAARLESRAACRNITQEQPNEAETAPQEPEQITPEPATDKTYLYHYNGLLLADTFENLQVMALKVAHDRGDFLKLEKVSKDIDASGRRWCSHAFEALNKLNAAQLVDYIEGRIHPSI